MERMTRRELGDTLFKAAVAYGLGSFLASCDNKNRKRNLEQVTPEPQTRAEQEAILRAASVQLEWNSASGFSTTVGRAGLFFDRRDGVVVKSIGHVVSPGNLRTNGSYLTMQMPENPAKFVVSSANIQSIPQNDPDGIYTLSIGDPNLRAFVDNQIANGRIKPLVEFPFQDLVQGEVLVTPGENVTTLMTYESYDPVENLLICNPKAGELCEGFSGQPVVRFDKRGLTTMSVGLVDGGYFPDLNQKCTTAKYYVRPHV